MEKIAATLFGKTRRALLARLYLEPERAFRVRELARSTGISAGAVQHELGVLAAAELVNRTEAENLVTYSANRRCPVFEELKGIVEKTSGIPELVRQALLPARRKIRLALIYGSIARGDNRSRSDLDVLVVGALSFADLLRRLNAVEERIGREISPRLFSAEEFEQRLRRSDRFLTAVLRGPKIMLIGSEDDAR
jgi:predicted nucleotidyltransferase